MWLRGVGSTALGTSSSLSCASQNLVHLEERTLATDYAEGLEMLHAQAALRLGVDVIVMDTLLPARKPLIVERLRAHIGRNVVIAVITGADDAREVCIACVRAGADVDLEGSRTPTERQGGAYASRRLFSHVFPSTIQRARKLR